MRLTCLYVPSFPLAARLRVEPRPPELPLVVVEGSGPAARVVSAGAAARALGVQPGFSLPQARALIPSLESKSRDEAAERSAQDALLEAADAFSPIVEDAAPGLVLLDADGEPDEHGFVERLSARAAALGLPACVGLAGTRTAARLAAETSAERGGAPVVVPEGGEQEFLAPLHVGVLSLSKRLLEKLDAWGIRTIGAFAALPPGETLRRLSPEGAALQRAARGVDDLPLVPRRPPADFSEGFSTDWPLGELEPFLTEAREAVLRLSARLESCDLACRRLDLELKLDPEGSDARRLRLAAPTRDAKTLVGLIGLELSARPPRAPIVGLVVTALPDRPRTAQLMLFGGPSVAPDKLPITIARLAAILGPDRVGRPVTVDGHKPERFAVAEFDLDAASSDQLRRVRCEGYCAVRSVRPAVELEAVLDDAGRPSSIRSMHNDGTHPEISGQARVAAGPWRLEEGWWLEDAVDREYWDVELADGGVYRLYRDARAERWYCDGIYD